jgi:hypothetical protein
MKSKKSKPVTLDRAASQVADYLLRKAGDIHVVVGPVSWQPADEATGAKFWYFIAATAGKNREFRCDQFGADNKADAEQFRASVMLALMQRRPIVIHDVDDEVRMARLCETLWPGERISRLRKLVEAERSTA